MSDSGDVEIISIEMAQSQQFLPMVQNFFFIHLGPDCIYKCHLTSIGNPIVEIRRSYDCLISTMVFPVLIRLHLYIESGPCMQLLLIHLHFDPKEGG